MRLEPGTTKNRLGRTFAFTPELRALLEAQRASTEKTGKQQGRIIPWVFHRRGKPIKDFKGAWVKACEAAGVPGNCSTISDAQPSVTWSGQGCLVVWRC